MSAVQGQEQRGLPLVAVGIITSIIGSKLVPHIAKILEKIGFVNSVRELATKLWNLIRKKPTPATNDIDENKPKEETPKKNKETKLPPMPKNLTIKFVHYVKDAVKAIHCNYVSETKIQSSKSYLKKKTKLCFSVMGKKQTKGKPVLLPIVDKIKPKCQNLFSMMYIKGKTVTMPVNSSAIVLMRFMHCLQKKYDVDISGARIVGDAHAVKIRKFVTDHAKWLQ